MKGHIALAAVVAAACATGAAVAAKAPDGRSLVRANCGSCHTMKAAGITGKVGPNLDKAKPSKAKVVRRVTKGAGAMPPFKKLSKAQVDAIAVYVSAKT